MTTSDLQVPGWPLAVIELGSESTKVNGDPVEVSPGEDARATAFAHAVTQAARIGRPIRVKVIESDGTERVLAAHPDGAETVLQEPKAQRGKKGKAPKPTKASKTAPKVPKTQGPASGTNPTEAVAPTAGGPHADLKPALAAGDWLAAATALKSLKGAGQDNRVAELESQLAGLRGDDASAAKQYAALALARHGSLGPDHPETVRAADLAQEAWGRVTDPDEAKRIGTALLALRDLVPGPGARAGAQVRAGLARLHVRTALEN
ncbi:hypothetical protein ACFZDG_35515 [Kitasatospora xanthocidica]|uniref:hypothetical protein n=1 Tax=Kitasatospora xanthocidica TaxID=83382 RepID=UPI0036EE1F8E